LVNAPSREAARLTRTSVVAVSQERFCRLRV